MSTCGDGDNRGDEFTVQGQGWIKCSTVVVGGAGTVKFHHHGDGDTDVTPDGEFSVAISTHEDQKGRSRPETSNRKGDDFYWFFLF